MTARTVLPVEVEGADGLALLGPLRAALSGAGPALAPHARGARPAPGAIAPLDDDEDDPADPVAAVVSTTGSTGSAKHVLLPAAALLASAAATHDRLGGSGRWLLAVPAHTVAGVQVVVRSLVAGTRPVAMDLTDGFDAAGFVAAAEALDGSRRYTSLVPTRLRRLLQAGPGTGALGALARFDAVLVGGAALDGRLRAQAETAGVAVVATYGMTETCGGCVYDGVPLPGVEAGIEDGRVVLSGPVVARGYRGRSAPGGSGRRRDPAPEGFGVGPDGRRRFRTADLGELVGGRLLLHGRADDVVVSGGVNVSLDAVAAVVRALPQVQDALAVGVPDAEWGHVVAVLVQPSPGTSGPDEATVRTAVRDRLGRAAVPRRVRAVPDLPLTGVGKPDRHAAVRVVTREPGDAARPGLRDHGTPTAPRPEEPTT